MGYLLLCWFHKQPRKGGERDESMVGGWTRSCFPVLLHGPEVSGSPLTSDPQCSVRLLSGVSLPVTVPQLPQCAQKQVPT